MKSVETVQTALLFADNGIPAASPKFETFAILVVWTAFAWSGTVLTYLRYNLTLRAIQVI